MDLVELSLKQFAEETASSSPAPGGGSVAALAGGLAGALGQMVLELTVGKKAFMELPEPTRRMILGVQEELMQARFRLMKLVDEDTKAFNGFMEALALPKSTDQEKLERNKAMQRATVQAIEVPYQTATVACQVLGLLQRIANHGNKNAISDLGVAALMARTAAIGAVFNVRINLLGLEDEALKQERSAQCDELEREVGTLEKEILAIVKAKLSFA